MKFIEQDKITTQDKDKEAEKMMQNRKKKETKIKNIDGKIQNLRSEIDKNKDVLTALVDHKTFLIALSPHQWVLAENNKKQEKLDRIRKEWIDFHKKNPRNDNIIFREKEELLALLDPSAAPV